MPGSPLHLPRWRKRWGSNPSSHPTISVGTQDVDRHPVFGCAAPLRRFHIRERLSLPDQGFSSSASRTVLWQSHTSPGSKYAPQ